MSSNGSNENSSKTKNEIRNELIDKIIEADRNVDRNVDTNVNANVNLNEKRSKSEKSRYEFYSSVTNLVSSLLKSREYYDIYNDILSYTGAAIVVHHRMQLLELDYTQVLAYPMAMSWSVLVGYTFGKSITSVTGLIYVGHLLEKVISKYI